LNIVINSRIAGSIQTQPVLKQSLLSSGAVKPGVVGAEFLTSGSSPPLLQAAIISPAMDRYRTFHFLFFNNFINSDGLALL
jgi:hypothetical protein